MIDESAEPRRAAWLYGLMQRGLWALLRQEEAVAALDRGLALLADDGPSPERAGLLARQAQDADGAVALPPRGRARRGGRWTSRPQLDTPGGYHVDEIGALNALGVSLMATGETEEGAAALRRALAMARERGNLHDVAHAAVNLADALHQAGRTEEALAVAREAHAELASLPAAPGLDRADDRAPVRSTPATGRPRRPRSPRLSAAGSWAAAASSSPRCATPS